MISFIKLLNFEFNRFFKFYLLIFILTTISQLSGGFIIIRQYLSRMHESISEGRMSPENYIEQFGKMTIFEILYSYSFTIPIAIGATGLLIYMFFIWYRDWFAKNAFIYRLLTLPINRMHLFWSKLCFMMITVLGLVALQIVLLKVLSFMIKMMVPSMYREDLLVQEVTAHYSSLNIIIPNTLLGFTIAYALGFLFVIVIFTAILFERSFRIKGIIFGVMYVIFSFVLFLSPFIITIYAGKSYLYQDEYFYIGTVLWFVILTMSLFISRYLLNKKVTV